MRLGVLHVLACPVCGGEIGFSRLDSYPTHDAEIMECSLGCRSCRAEYPVIGGVPQMRPPGAVSRGQERTRRSFSWEWLRYPGPRKDDGRVLLEETMLSPADFAGKTVLDAGCGMGRFSVVALALGAEVVAADLSDGLWRVAEAAHVAPKLHPVVADLLRPPFKKGAFDVVYSQGVLHHTPSTRAAFFSVAPLVKRGGLLSVWVYGKAGRYRDFATNPLRPGRGWLKWVRPLAWLVVLGRHIVSDLVRAFTKRLPIPVVYALCYPLAFLGAFPLLKLLTFSTERGFRVRLIENFDWLSPPYQWHHTKEELSSWFEEAGFSVLRVLPHGLVPKPGVLGRRVR